MFPAASTATHSEDDGQDKALMGVNVPGPSMCAIAQVLWTARGLVDVMTFPPVSTARQSDGRGQAASERVWLVLPTSPTVHACGPPVGSVDTARLREPSPMLLEPTPTHRPTAGQAIADSVPVSAREVVRHVLPSPVGSVVVATSGPPTQSEIVGQDTVVIVGPSYTSFHALLPPVGLVEVAITEDSVQLALPW